MIEVPSNLVLRRGGHTTRDDGMCLLEAAAWLAGETHSDKPECVCPTIASFGRNWNDSLRTDEERTRLLAPLLPHMIGTATGGADRERRAWLAMDWQVRVQVPTWLSLTPSLADHAERLRALPEIVTPSDQVMADLLAANKAASKADPPFLEDDTAWGAVRAAAGGAANVASWNASWLDVGHRESPRNVAWSTLCAASCAAPKRALAPTVPMLQVSAADLVLRMCAVGREA